MYFVYILYSEKVGKKYIGQTLDLNQRIDQHNSNFFKSYTNNKGPWILIYKEEFQTRKEALAREKWLKSGVGRDWIRENIKMP
jgi:putative endonuclease